MGQPVDLVGFPYQLIATLTQTGASAPVMTTGLNTLPLGIGTWTRSGLGNYRYTLSGQFIAGKVFPFITFGDASGPGCSVYASRLTVNVITVQTFDASGANDDIIINAPFLIILLK